MSNGGRVPVSRPLRERFWAFITCSNSLPEKSSQRSEQKRASKETGVSGAHGKGKTNEAPTSRKSTTGITDKKQPSAAVQQPAKSNTGSPPSAKIANYEPPTPQIRRGGSVAASRHSSSTMKRMNSKSMSGELSAGGPSLKKSTSRSLRKLRDHYVGVMMKLGDMSNGVHLGNSVTFESQVFESEVIRKQSQMENEIMEFYLHSGIQPGEWKDARMGSRIMRNQSITV